ncbi:hypothetical protein ACMD2_26686 [Ananas comosus]|uniref:Uncharacterized protein n=1 Tax=Ananas comosus TaxID=4615 RepID=A0A199UQP0_ANACO|nr:hypothetical protein ACMD2_26686 [Ananas comosus]
MKQVGEGEVVELSFLTVGAKKKPLGKLQIQLKLGEMMLADF